MANRKHGTNIPVLTVKTYKPPAEYAHEAILKVKGVEIGRVVYRPHSPLGCGAHVWIEVETKLVDVELLVHDLEETNFIDCLQELEHEPLFSEEDIQNHKEEAVLKAIQKGWALFRRGKELFTLDAEGVEQKLVTSESYETLWYETLKKLGEM